MVRKRRKASDQDRSTVRNFAVDRSSFNLDDPVDLATYEYIEGAKNLEELEGVLDKVFINITHTDKYFNGWVALLDKNEKEVTERIPISLKQRVPIKYTNDGKIQFKVPANTEICYCAIYEKLDSSYSTSQPNPMTREIFREDGIFVLTEVTCDHYWWRAWGKPRE